MRRVDSKGRVVIGREYAGTEVYVVRVGNGYYVTPSKEEAELVRRRGLDAVLETYYRLLDFLGEPTPEEVEKVAEEDIWRGASSTHRY